MMEKSRRGFRRLLVVGLVAGTSALAMAGPVLAETPSTWTKAEPTPWLETLGIFVGIPAGMFLLITLAVLAPSMVQRGGSQAGLSWWATPQRFGQKPVDDDAEPSEQELADLERGGAGARW